MGERVSKADLDNLFESYTKAANRMGLDPTGWHLVHGSKVQGVSYRVLSGPGSPAPGSRMNGFIGRTRKEASETLETIIRTMEDVQYHLSR